MKKVINKIFIYIFMLIIIFISVIPFVYMVMMSFKSTTNAYDFDFSLEKLTLMQYQKIFSLANFPNYVFNSVFVAVVGVILTVTVCSLAGYAFAKMDFKGNDKLFIFLIMTMVVPSEVIIIPLFLIIKNLGWLNTFKALILPLPTAFGVFIMRQAILDIPDDLINAAKIDGCGRLRIFFKVVLPMVSCSKQEMKTLPLALGMMKTLYNTDVGLTMACAVINFLPPFIFYVFMQSKFKEGMTLSGIKG